MSDVWRNYKNTAFVKGVLGISDNGNTLALGAERYFIIAMFMRIDMRCFI
jgi:hypothetical protein